MKKNPKKAARISLTLAIISIILLLICHTLDNVDVVEKYGLIIDEGRPSILEIILFSTSMILLFSTYIINNKMSVCPKCNKYISGNINMEYCPYCSEKFPDVEENEENS